MTEEEITCAELARAMALASTTAHRRVLAHLFTLRPEPCPETLPHLVRWLDDADEHVARDAADGLGLLLASIRSPQRLAAAQLAAGGPLFRYAQDHAVPFVLAALAVTAHQPARAYLQGLAADGARPLLQESAVTALRSFDWYASPHHAGQTPPR